MSQLKVLFLGDIVGKIGRKAVKESLPKLKKKYKPDFIIANAENLAHGKSVTEKTLQEMSDAGIDFFTSGNHIWANPESEQILSEQKFDIIRPANYPEGVPGFGHKIIEVGTKKVLVANQMGRVFFREDFENPFTVMEDILKQEKGKFDFSIVDLHAEATSEKVSFAKYFDGKVDLVIGTHTHVQTADEKVLEEGTGFISDAGMVGAKDSSIGVDFKNVLHMFFTQMPKAFELPESGTCIINGIFATIKQDKGVTKIERVSEEVDV
ncbi:TIGR00282 family metallophosphoesterase [Candidatus Falkowbacteria bacterium]|jgi:2',3'-cyclic-nucleotide 2'-phosphodiesterase|nr:TIGR00282 family metallophosphoesterase [Candidatus Falkowbacteria bacterium]MBT7007002.1 TIGR00282 family metallophosphoesterase [Candidatus Falkowbacteria bacterium]